MSSPAPLRKQLRRLASLAYERELAAELGLLEQDFARWKKGKLDAFELSERVHRFHDGPSRRLWVAYQSGMLEFTVALALHRKLISKKEAGPAVLASLASRLKDFAAEG